MFSRGQIPYVSVAASRVADLKPEIFLTAM
jgi:hypothetical protein